MDAIAHPATRRLDSSLHAVGTPSPGIPVESVRTLSVTADYRLSEAGRKASLLSGGNGRAEQRVKIAVPLTRLHLVHVDNSGVARLKLRPQFKLNTDQRIVKIKFAPVYDHPPTLDELFQDAARNHELERAYHAQRATAQAARRETLDVWRNQVALEFLGDPNRRAVVYPPPSKRRCQVMTDRGPVHFDAKRDMGVARQIPLEAFRRFDNDIRISHGRGADQRARNLARHAQRQQMMHEWITLHGSHDQRERLSAGVLPFKEFVDALAEVTFQPLSHITPYRTDGSARMQEQLRQLPGHADSRRGCERSVGRHASAPDGLSEPVVAGERNPQRYPWRTGAAPRAIACMDARRRRAEGPTGVGTRDHQGRACAAQTRIPVSR